MKAKEAAEHVIKNPEINPTDILHMMPIYPNQLHKRQWIHTFLKNLPDALHADYRQILLDQK